MSLFNKVTKTFQWGGRTVTLETGEIARQSGGAVVVTDGDLKLAEDLRDELLDRAWVEREAFVYQIEPLAQSVARAKAMPPETAGDGPVVLLDHYDNCASGGTMDTTVVLAEILRQGLENVAAFAIEPAGNDLGMRARKADAVGVGQSHPGAQTQVRAIRRQIGGVIRSPIETAGQISQRHLRRDLGTAAHLDRQCRPGREVGAI